MNQKASSPAPTGWVSEKELARHLQVSPRHAHVTRLQRRKALEEAK